MKKILIAFVAVSALTLSSCSKDTRINNQLDGSWNVTKFENSTLPSGQSITLTFSKDKKGKGTGTQTVSGTGIFDGTTSFTYEVLDEKLIQTTVVSGFTNKEISTIKEHSKDKMILINTDNEETILEAK